MDLYISKVIEMLITIIAGEIELNSGLRSKLKASALPILDTNSNNKPRETPKNIFFPSVASRVEPKINSMAIKIIAISVNGLTSLL